VPEGNGGDEAHSNGLRRLLTI